jgi:hypothetical protein
MHARKLGFLNLKHEKSLITYTVVDNLSYVYYRVNLICVCYGPKKS